MPINYVNKEPRNINEIVIKNQENIKHKNMKIKIQGHLITLYMTLFQSSFLILGSKHCII